MPAFPWILVTVLAACHGDAGDTGGSDTDGTADTDSGTDTDTDDTDTGADSWTVCASGAPYTSIQDAIDASDVGAVIAVCPGTYRELLTIDHALTIEGTDGADVTIVDADGAGRSVDVSGGGSVVLRGLSIEGGRDADVSAVRAVSTDLTLEECVVRDATAVDGVTLSTDAGSLTIVRSTVLDTTSSRASGVYATGDAHLEGVVFQGQITTRAGGEVLQFGPDSQVELFDVVVAGSSVTSGATIFT